MHDIMEGTPSRCLECHPGSRSRYSLPSKALKEELQLLKEQNKEREAEIRMRVEHNLELMAAPENEEDTEIIDHLSNTSLDDNVRNFLTELSTRKNDGETYSINMHSTQRLYKVNNRLGYRSADDRN